MSSSRMVDTMAESSSDSSCSSCAKLKEALEASKKEHSLTLRMVKEKIISTDELIKKYQQKCHESDKHQQQSTDTALKLEAAQMKIESLQSQLDRSLHSSEPLRKNVARLHREKSLADSTIIELREKLQNFEKTNSQLLSTVKIKEEQECAWRLEKQVQADEMHKQKKSLQKSEATITKLQEEIKKEKEKNKELNKLLSQAKRKATKMEQQLQKSKEEMESVKLEAEFAKALEEDLTKKTSKPRQRQKARQPPRQPPVELKQTSPSASHPNQQLAHIIEELAVLSDMEPALSPLPPSPDREGLGDSSISEEESGSGSSSEDDGSEIEDEDSDYSLGDLADMLIGEHGENLAAGTIKTRSSDQDVHEDAENSSGGETKTKNVIDCAKPENESSARQSPNEGNSSDVEFSENLSIVNCDVANTENKVSKTLKMNQESTGIEAEMNENLHITESDSSDRRKTDDECAKTKEPSNTEKCAVVTPSPQRKAKQRIASPKPHVMTRSRAKAMKLSSSSDAESSSERESGMEVIQTQETSAEVSDTGLKRNSNATDIGTSNDGGSGSNEHVSSDALVDNKNEFTESSQAKESQAHVEGFLSDSSSYDADDVAHHHGNLFEAVCSKTSLADLQDQEPTEDTSNVLLVGAEADVLNYQRNNGQLSCSATLLTDVEEQVDNEDNSDAFLRMDTNATHQQRDDSDVSCSGALLTNSEIRAGDEDNSNALVGMDTNATHQQRDDSDVSCSGALLTNSEIRAGDEDNSNALVGMDTNATHQQKNDSDVSCSGALLTDSEKQAGNEDNLNVLTVGMDADTISKQRQDSDVSYSGALLTDSEKQAGNEDNFNVLTVGMDADTISQQRQDSDVSCSEALLTDSEKQAGNENHSDVFTGGQEVNGSRLGHSTGLLSEQVTIEDSSDETSVPVSKAAANTSTEVTIDNEQQFSSTSESGSEIKSSASLNMTKEESSNITEIPSLQLNNENCTTVLVNKIITEKSTEEIQTSQDNKITADVNGTTLLLQSETKENTFHRGEDTLEENNNDVSEGFEASHEQVGSALEVDADSYDQTQSFVPKNYNQSTCTTEIKTSDGSEVSSTCDGTKKEHRLKEQLYFPSDEESDVDSFPCVVPGKVPKSAETSKGEPADVISSTVEVDVNQSTVTCEKETTIPTASTAETTQWSSIKGHEVESSKDNKLTLEEGGHSRTSDEAMESCSTDEHERKDSKGQDSSVTENFPVLTSESSLKDSELDKGESFISDGEQFSSCNDERKNSDFVKVKDVLASKPVTEEANEPSTSNDGRKNSDFVNVNDVPTSKIVIEEANEPSTSNDGSKNFDLVKVIKDVPTSKTVIEEANEPSTSNDGRKNSDFVNVKYVPASKTVSEEPNQPSTSNDGRKNSDLVKVNIDVPTSKTVIEKANEPSTSTDGRNNSDLVKVKDVLASKTVTEEANEPSTSNDGRKNSDFVKVKDVPTSKTVIEEAIGPSASNDGRKNSDCVKGAPACKTAIKDARDPLTPNAGREESHSGRDLSSTAMTKNRSSTSNDEKRHFVKKKDLSSRNTSNERSSTVHEGRKNSDMGKAVSFTAMCKEGSSAFNDEKRHFDNKEYLSSRNTSNERSVVHEVVHEGRKRSVMGNDVPVTATRKESCSVLNEGEKNSTLGRDVSSRVVSNESCSSFNVGRRNSDLGRRVCPRIITEEGSSSSKEGRNYSECEKEMLPYVREPSTLITERKPCVIKRDVSSARTVAEKAGIRKGLSPPQLDVNESKLEEGGKSLELPWSSNDKGPSDDFPAACDPMDDSPIEISFNNLECLLEEFPALSPLPPSPCRSDDEECSTSLISSNNLNKESSNRVTDLTPTKKTFDASGKPELRRGRTLNCTEVASRTVKRTSLEKTATMCVTESNKGNISATPRTRLAKEKANESASTPCSRRNASMKRPLQRPVSASPCAAEIISLKRSYQQSVCEPVDNTDAVSQKIKKIRTQPNIPDKNETSSLEKRLHMSTIPVKKATCSQPSKKNGAIKGSILVNGKGPILAGRKNPKLAGNKEPIRADRKGPILVGDKEPILVDADGPILEFNEKPVLEDKSNNPNTGNSAKVTKQDRYRPLSIRPGYMPEVKYMFKCLSRVHEDNVDLHVVVARLTTKRCISSSTPVASAIIQFLKEREDDLIPLILDQLGRFKTDGSLNNWQPVISSFESRLLEVVSLLSSDTLFGNLIPRLVSLCSRSLTEARCSSNDEEVTKGELSLCRVLTALCQLKKSLFCARTVCYDVIRSLYRAQNAALELVVTMITVWPEVLKSSSACSRGQQSPLAQTLKLVLLYWAETYTSGDLGNVLRVLCCWEDDLVTEEELKRFGLQLIQSFHGERVEASVVLGKDGSMVLDRHSFEVVKSLELLSCVLGWQWTLNEVIVNNVWQILKSWAEKERREPTTNGSQPHAASCSEENTVSACFCSDFNVSKEVSSVTVLADKETSSRSGFRTAGEKKEERNQAGGEDEVPEICSKCGKLTRRGLPESQAVLCIQLLGVLCRIAIDNGQTAVHEITNMLCGLMEDSSPTSKSRVTYAVQLASAISLLDMSPWQPERVAVVLSKWVTALKESGSLQAPANVAQGLVCLKSFLRINQT